MKNVWHDRGKMRRLAQFLNQKFGSRSFCLNGLTEADGEEIATAFFAHEDYHEDFGWYLDDEGEFHVTDDPFLD